MKVEISDNMNQQQNAIAAAIRRGARTEADMDRLEEELGSFISKDGDHG
jgi:hypothetical protein